MAPKALLDALLYPHVKMEKGEVDVTCFRVEVCGVQDGQPRRYKIEMVDRFDQETGFTSMARTTAMTGAIVARMAARGDLEASGLLRPEQVITGPLFDRLIADLAEMNIHFELTTAKTETMS